MHESEPLIECVPNVSEGRDRSVIEKLADAISATKGCLLLNSDSNLAANRTVFTFVASPGAAVEAAFNLVREASAAIDMRRHEGAHPRIGAVDVCPLIPIRGVTMSECCEHAAGLARRIGSELDLPVYLYENSATSPERRALSYLRKGEYEGLAQRIEAGGFAPDYGPARFVSNFGAVAVGAREFLIAYNINLDRPDLDSARAIARAIRQRSLVIDSGLERRDALPGVRALGWIIPEFGCSQVSVNISDFRVTGMHKVYESCCRLAADRGRKVTGSELVGLVPKAALLDSGAYFAQKLGRERLSEKDVMDLAADELRLYDKKEFVPTERVLELRIDALHRLRGRLW